MFKFPTQFDTQARIHCDPGNPIKILYKPKVHDDGILELVEAGQESLYDFIQSWKDSTDINVLLARYANGDVEALSKVQGAYGDFTQFPSTYAEMLNRVEQGKHMFASLPLEIREKYNHDFSQFIAAMDQPDFWDQFKPADDVKEGEANES